MVIFQRLSAVVQGSNIIGIDNRLPLAVQTGCLTRIDICNQRRNLRRASTGEEKRTKSNCQTAD